MARSYGFWIRRCLVVMMLGLGTMLPHPPSVRAAGIDDAARAALPEATRVSGVLRIATSLQWPPFAYQAEHGEADGIDIRLIKVLAEKLGLKPEFIPGDWRTGADAAVIEEHLRKDKAHAIKAVCVLHNETATGCLSPIEPIRKAINAAGHPALLMVDTISSLASMDYRHDEWGVDVSVGGAQKGLMLPPGMSFNAISDKALAANKTSKLPKSFWAWDDMLAMNKVGFFPYTPGTQMLQGLAVGIEMLHEEGLDNVFARHDRLAEATRRAVKAWGLENLNKNANQYSPTITAILLPEGHDADAFRALALENFNISYGASFGAYAGKYFRIGHLGDINDGTLVGALGITEMALQLANVPIKKGGVQAALDYLTSQHGAAAKQAAD